MPYQVRQLAPGEIGEASRLLGRAFVDDPFIGHLLADGRRRRLAFSMPWVTAISTSAVTWRVLSSDRWFGMATAPAAAGGIAAEASVVAGECTASGWAVCDLLILGICAWDCGAEVAKCY